MQMMLKRRKKAEVDIVGSGAFVSESEWASGHYLTVVRLLQDSANSYQTSAEVRRDEPTM